MCPPYSHGGGPASPFSAVTLSMISPFARICRFPRQSSSALQWGLFQELEQGLFRQSAISALLICTLRRRVWLPSDMAEPAFQPIVALEEEILKEPLKKQCRSRDPLRVVIVICPYQCVEMASGRSSHGASMSRIVLPSRGLPGRSASASRLGRRRSG